MVCQTVFQAFKCQRLSEEHEFLSVDFQTDCTTDGFTALQLIAVLMVVVYPIGIPASLFAALWRNRAELSKAESDKGEEFAPLVEAYKLDCWYWWVKPAQSCRKKQTLTSCSAACREALEMGRKVVLTGVMIFFRPGSVQQLLVGGLIAAFYMAAAVSKRPFVSRFDNNL